MTETTSVYLRGHLVRAFDHERFDQPGDHSASRVIRPAPLALS